MAKRQRPALWGHDYEASGIIRSFADADHDICKWCKWPFDEHPNHPTRKENPSIVAVSLEDRRDIRYV